MPGKFNKDDYISVQDRINRFWNEYPDGAINTDTVYSRDFDNVVIKAEVYKHKDDQRPSATGIAAEERGADVRSGANFTSWHENAETSAIGRALANMSYATSHQDRPSREEMAKVERMEQLPPRGRRTSENAIPNGIPDDDPPEMVTTEQLHQIEQLIGQKGLTAEGVKKLHGQRHAGLLTKDEAEKLIITIRDYPDAIAAQVAMVPNDNADRWRR